jgi:hypothetical protein
MCEILISRLLLLCCSLLCPDGGLCILCHRLFKFIWLFNQFVSLSFQVSYSTWQRPLMMSAGPSKNYILSLSIPLCTKCSLRNFHTEICSTIDNRTIKMHEHKINYNDSFTSGWEIVWSRPIENSDISLNKYFAKSVTFHTLPCRSVTTWSYAPASRLNSCSCNIELICYILAFVMYAFCYYPYLLLLI